MNGVGTWRGAQRCRQEAVWTWRCGLVEPDDVNGVVRLYGGRRAAASRGSCPAYTAIRPPERLSIEPRGSGVVTLRFGRPSAPPMPPFLAALTRSEGGWAMARSRNACPTGSAEANRYVWTAGIGEQMAIADRPSPPGRYCYALWSTDPLGRPSERPATAWVTV
jgi:hypothetical protein